MKRHFIAIAATIIALFASPSHAGDEHTVYILKKGYFPTTTYLGPDDSIKFVNVSGYWAKVRKSDGNSLTGWIANGDDLTATVQTLLYYNNNSKRFLPPRLYNWGYTNTHPSYFSFDPAPSS